jgi:hypothetical protein
MTTVLHKYIFYKSIKNGKKKTLTEIINNKKELTNNEEKKEVRL